MDVGAEEAAAGDAESEADHLGVKFDFAVLRRPCGAHLVRQADDFGAVARQARAMEGGLGETPLAQVEGFFAGEQAVAEDTAGAAEDDAAEMVAGVADEHVGDEVGVVELELAKAVGGEEAGDVPVLGGVLLVEGGRVDREEGSVPDAAGEAGAMRVRWRVLWQPRSSLVVRSVVLTS